MSFINFRKKSSRSVILHYHLFKNAGTSLDGAFKQNFPGDEWLTKEFSPNPKRNKKEITDWILDNPDAICFSSHTAILHVSKIKNVKVLPVIFIRHPVDRIASVYNFEKQQDANSFGAVLARNTDMAGYIETRLSLKHDRQCRDFHIDRLAAMVDENQGNELERALMAVERLPFVGVVEQFENSLKRLEGWLQEQGHTSIKLETMHKNISRDSSKSKSLKMKLSEIEKQIGSSNFKKLLEENERDLVLYDRALSKI